MLKKVSKNIKCCALCKNYNNGWGASSLKVEGRLFVSYESTEKRICSINGITRDAWFKCEKFVSRF